MNSEANYTLAQARQEIEKLRTIVRQQQQQIENAMAQVHDSVRKRENHKADLVRALCLPSHWSWQLLTFDAVRCRHG